MASGQDRYHAGQTPGQAQMRRDECANQPSNIHASGQDPTFLQQTGEQVKNLAQGAAQGAVNVAQGAAHGAANMAHGAADAVKRTLGMNPDNSPDNTSNAANCPGNTDCSGNTNYPKNANYPSSTNHPSNPRI